MANRAYLYSLSNRPISYADRPDTISGLSEWAYAVPFSYRVLMSGNPQLCASLVSDGFDGEPADRKTKLYAISGDFEAGFARLKRLMCAQHVLQLGGESPLQTLTGGTVSRKQLRCREASWGGSWRQSSDLRNTNRV